MQPIGRLGLILLLAGCSRDNGVPGDVLTQLSGRGISVRVVRQHAPLSTRAGYVVAGQDQAALEKIIRTFELKSVPRESASWKMVSQVIGETTAIQGIWGVNGRPTLFKLKDGGQFEYFYVVLTANSEMYMVAEYAYG